MQNRRIDDVENVAVEGDKNEENEEPVSTTENSFGRLTQRRLSRFLSRGDGKARERLERERFSTQEALRRMLVDGPIDQIYVILCYGSPDRCHVQFVEVPILEDDLETPWINLRQTWLRSRGWRATWSFLFDAPKLDVVSVGQTFSSVEGPH